MILEAKGVSNECSARGRRHRRLPRHRPGDRDDPGGARLRRRRGIPGSGLGAAEVVDAVTSAGGRAIAAQADVADENAVAAMFDAAEKEFGGIDVVVNSAGRLTLSPIADLDLDDLDALHRTNIRGTFVIAREAARRVRDGGTIITMSTSVVGLQLPAYGAYVASKGAVEAMTLVLARELRGRQITVNAVAPGPTATELFFEGKDEATIERMAKQPRSNGSAPPRTSRRSSPSWRAPRGTGSTGRSCARTAASSDPGRSPPPYLAAAFRSENTGRPPWSCSKRCLTAAGASAGTSSPPRCSAGADDSRAGPGNSPPGPSPAQTRQRAAHSAAHRLWIKAVERILRKRPNATSSTVRRRR